jgi:hypothetical protein
MGSKVRYISSKQQLIGTVEALLNDNSELDIMISGVWSKSLHESIIELIIEKKYSSTCGVIIPRLLFKGDLSLTLLRNLCKAEGQVRVNNSLTNNLLFIGEYVFILSFTSKLNSMNMMNTTFECAVMIDDGEIVNQLKAQFNEYFENSVIFKM